MKKWMLPFVAGALASSVAWGAYLIWFQLQVSNAFLLGAMQHALTGQKIINIVTNTPDDLQKHIQFIGLNMVEEFPRSVDYLGKEYPYLPLRDLWSGPYDTFNAYLSRHERTNSANHASHGTALPRRP